ncbi:MAG TPA: glycosyltransferase family 1 protein [Burkholderiaceae bacterium]|nr:glycosyltransferase family 1 protein [Burkholderiaceae bacterium]
MAYALAGAAPPSAHSATCTPARIVFNGRFLSQVATGVQRYACETLRAFDALLDDDAALRQRLACELAVPTPASAPALRRVVVRRLAGPRGHLWEQLTLARYARSAYLVNFGYSGPLLKRRQLITLHDASVQAVAHAYSWQYRLLHDAFVRVLGRRVDTVMTVSNFSRDELAARYHVRPGIVGLEGWEHSRAQGDSAATLAKWKLQPQSYILAVGSHKPHKNFELLDRAMAQLGDYPLTIAVAGAPDIGIFRHSAGAQRFARMLGFVSDEELAHLYRNAAWFVFPSTYEGFGLPAIEAMANGCPVLAARAGSIPEVCADAALYFDPHDPGSLVALLRRVMCEPRLRQRLVDRAAARLALYSWSGNARILAGHLVATTA